MLEGGKKRYLHPTLKKVRTSTGGKTWQGKHTLGKESTGKQIDITTPMYANAVRSLIIFM